MFLAYVEEKYMTARAPSVGRRTVIRWKVQKLRALKVLFCFHMFIF